jgi:hypothetical protein
VQKVGIVLRQHATLGVIEVIGAGRANDVPNTIAISGNVTGANLSGTNTGNETINTIASLVLNNASAQTTIVDTAVISFAIPLNAPWYKITWANLRSQFASATNSWIAVQTFLDGMLGLRNVANTFTSFFKNTNTASRTYTLKDADGTIAFTSDITGTNSGTNTGDVTLAGTPNYITIVGQVITRALIDLTSHVTGKLPFTNIADVNTGTVMYRKTASTGAMESQTLATLKTDLGLTGTNSGDQTITLTGDVTGSGTGSFGTTLATVNANTGSWGLAGSVAQFTANAKGLITAAANVAISITSSQVSDFSSSVAALITGKANSSTTISTTAPLSGGGDLSANRTLTTSMSTNKLIGRGTAGTGVMEEITLGTNLSLTGTTLNAAGGGSLTTQDEGVTLSTGVTTLNFTGAGVTASGAGATTTINIPGGGGAVLTAGSVPFSDGSTLIQDNANFFFNNTNEQLGVGANTFLSTGNVINAKATNTGTAQINVQNGSTGTSASSDLVATADNGTDSTNYINVGKNSSTYADTGFTSGVADDGYLMDVGGNLGIITATAGKVVKFFTGGTLAANLRGTLSDTILNMVGNVSGANVNQGLTQTATSAGTKTLTVADNGIHQFTGTTTHTLIMPVTSTLILGWSYEAFNDSTGVITVNSSGGNLIGTIKPGQKGVLICKDTAVTTAAGWNYTTSTVFNGVRAYQSTTTGLQYNAWGSVGLAFDNTAFDTNNFHSNSTNNSRITFAEAGTYLVGSSIQSSGIVGFGIKIRLNGTTDICVGGTPYISSGAATSGASTSTIYSFAAGDYIEVLAAADTTARSTLIGVVSNFWASQVTGAGGGGGGSVKLGIIQALRMGAAIN